MDGTVGDGVRLSAVAAVAAASRISDDAVARAARARIASAALHQEADRARAAGGDLVLVAAGGTATAARCAGAATGTGDIAIAARPGAPADTLHQHAETVGSVGRDRGLVGCSDRPAVAAVAASGGCDIAVARAAVAALAALADHDDPGVVG